MADQFQILTDHVCENTFLNSYIPQNLYNYGV